ncbi:MAG: sel1 repeat family protein, partial [Clostridia bacterium]|nr:sel1 repeat family protein [Clostridia bacterium]
YDVSNCVLGAVAYNNGRYDEAIEHFNRYANLKNDSTAYFYYGDSFIRRFDPDYKQAAKILDYCVEIHKNPNAAARLCDLYDKDAPFENIADYYYYAKTEADLGSKPACEFIAVSIKTGEYVPSGASNAMMLHYLKEAEPELSYNGCCLAGDIYFEEYVNGGLSDERLYAAAKQYIERSLKLNSEFTLANHLMGEILLCKERRPEAAYYYEKAFNAGYEDSCESLFTTLVGMPGKQEKANRYARIIIKNNYKVTNPFVYSSVAFNIVQGLCGEKPDYAEAGKLFVRAAEMGDVISMDMVGLTRVEYGTSAVPTHVAIGWLEKADSLGSKDALYYLGVIYIQENQSAKAVDCLNKATDKGNADAARKMAELYECGYITGKREKKKAKSWKEIADRLDAAR